MHDPNFAEYKKCPLCRKYFSEDEVENKGIKTCKGKNNTHEETPLVDAWTPEMVDEELNDVLRLGDDFFGAIALSPEGKVVGFVWGYARDLVDQAKRWTIDLVSKIQREMPCDRITYFQEIASDPNLRKMGIGSLLCASLVNWMKQKYPDYPSMLHTHQNSPALRLFQKSGYLLYAKLDQLNVGRIFLVCPTSSQLTPENLSR